MRRLLIAGAATLVFAGVAFADAPQPSSYLSAAESPDTISVLPAAPTAGTQRYESDRKIFLATRKLKGTDRWAMAQRDDDTSMSALAEDFTCSLGVTLNAADEPRTVAMVERMYKDIGRALGAAKDHFQRKRPFLIDKGDTCIPVDAAFSASYDYPSGHTTRSWAEGLVLAELAPDRATQILARARAFGESRIVCGVHNASAVEEGRTEAAIVVAALHGSAQFRADMDAARSEIAAARAKAAPVPDRCAAEAALVAQPVY